MLKEEVYIKTSNEFGTPVGVANIIGYKTKEEGIEEMGTAGWKETSRDIQINEIIKEAIYRGKYKELSREVWRRREENKILKTKYKEAWDWIRK